MDKPLRLACDFDGVLHDPQNKRKGYKMGQPVPGAPAAMKQLHEQGAILVIHSLWATTEKRCQAIAEWCRYFGIPYDFITSQKPDCDAYIDNKAIRFTHWHQTLQDIERYT